MREPTEITRYTRENTKIKAVWKLYSNHNGLKLMQHNTFAMADGYFKHTQYNTAVCP